MSDTPPYAVVIIKPLTVGRSQGPAVLQAILDRAKVDLSLFRPWTICTSTWEALHDISKGTDSAFDLEANLSIRSTKAKERNSWVGLFTPSSPDVDVHQELSDLFGPPNPVDCVPTQIRWYYSAINHPADDVVYLSPKGKEKLIASLLFENFKEESIGQCLEQSTSTKSGEQFTP